MEGNPVHPVAAAGPVAVADAAPRPVPAPPPIPPVRLPVRVDRGLRALAVIGAILTLVGWILARERTCGGILLASHYVLGLGLGGLVFIVLGYATRAGWMAAFRRVPEAMAGTIPLGAVLTLVAFLGMSWLYHHWMHPAPDDHLLQEKGSWLNVGGFVARAIVVLAVWCAFGWAIRRVSTRQDETGDPAATNRNAMLSGLFLVVFALTFSLASFDWIMSLEPHWYSTVFAVYDFAGLFVSALAAMLILLIALRRMGPLAGILSDDHLHDIAKLTFGFATFWGYIWFCQYMLIWYGNIPEETAYFVARREGAWSVLTLVNPVVNWLIPFLVLLPREAKRRESLLLKVAALLLLGRWLDLYQMINPSISPGGPAVGFWEFAPLAVALPLFVFAFFRVLARARILPIRDPMLGESLHHHV
jgi:hypothetical protein